MKSLKLIFVLVVLSLLLPSLTWADSKDNISEEQAKARVYSQINIPNNYTLLHQFKFVSSRTGTLS